jgi:DnaJ-class molecular chaperone
MGEAESSRDPYAVLGVPAGAPHELVRRAYRATLKGVHPAASRGDAAAIARLHELMAAYDAVERRHRERVRAGAPPEPALRTSGLLVDVLA